MPNAAELVALARQLKDAQVPVRQAAPFCPHTGDFDVSFAYEVADLVHRERVQEGAVSVGREIGFTNPDMWSIYGVGTPMGAYAYDATVVHVSGGHARCNLGEFTEPKIDPEIVLYCRTSPAPGGGLSARLASIGRIALGIDVVQSHFLGWKFLFADTIPDWALHGTLLVGAPQSVDRLGPDLTQRLERLSLSLFKDETLREVGTGANVLGSPLSCIGRPVVVREKQPQHLPVQAGEWVTTGTITTAQSVGAGKRWRTDVRGAGLPGLSVEFSR